MEANFIIAIAGLILSVASFILACFIAYLQCNTYDKQRRQELYEPRYKFYQELQNIYYSLDNPTKNTHYIQFEDISHLLSRSEWLFGKDMRKAINDLNSRTLDEMDKKLGILPDYLERIFAKYMTIEKNSAQNNIIANK